MPPGDDERVDIDVVMHDLTSPAAENIDRKLRDIGNESGRSSDAMDDLADSTDNEDRQLAKLNRRMDAGRHKMSRFERVHRRWDRLFQRNTKSIGKHNTAMDRHTTSVDKAAKAHDRLSRSADKSRRSMTKFFSFSPNFSKAIGLIKISAILEALPLLATALSAVGAAGVAAVAGLAPLVGVAGAGATGITALAQSIGTIKMSMSGIGDALKVLNKEGATAEEIAQALATLPINARKFVVQLKDIQGVWKNVRKEVQNTFFTGLDRKLEKISTGYLPIMRRNLKANADALNLVVKGFADMLLEARNMRTIDKIMRRNNRIVESGGRGLTAVAEAFIWIARAAGPMTERMTNDFTEWLMGKSTSAQRNQKELREFFNDSYDLLKKTIGVLDDFGEGLMNVGRASKPLQRYLGKGIADIAEGFNKWTSQPENMKRMRNFFREMREPLGEFTRLVGKLSGGILTLAENDDGSLASIFRRLSDETVPALVSAFSNLQKGGTIDAIIDLANAFVKLIDSGFIGASGPIVRALAAIAGAFADFFSSLPKDMRTAVVALMMGTSMIGKLNFGAITRGGGLKNGLAGGLLGGAATKGIGGKLFGGGKFMGATPVYVVNPGFGGVGGKPGVKPGVPVITGGGAGAAAGGAGTAVGGGIRAALTRIAPKAARLGGGVVGAGAIALVMEQFLSGEKLESAMQAASERNSKTTVPQLVEFIGQRQLERNALMQAINSGNVPDPGNAMIEIERLDKELLGLRYRFDDLSTMSVPQYQQALSTLPEDVRTQISTPGALDSEEEVHKLLQRLDLTPTEKFTTLAMLGIPTSMSELKKLQNQLENIHDRKVRLQIEIAGAARLANLERSIAAGGQGGGFGPQLWTGGPTQAGKWYLTGEQGPEAHVDKMGRIRMLGMRGPEFVKPGSGAVVNTAATRDPWGGDANKTPEWAVTALKKAAGASARQAAARAAEGDSGGSYSLQVGPIYPQSEMDVEGAVRRAWQKLEKERRERS